MTDNIHPTIISLASSSLYAQNFSKEKAIKRLANHFEYAKRLRAENLLPYEVTTRDLKMGVYDHACEFDFEYDRLSFPRSEEEKRAIGWYSLWDLYWHSSEICYQFVKASCWLTNEQQEKLDSIFIDSTDSPCDTWASMTDYLADETDWDVYFDRIEVDKEVYFIINDAGEFVPDFPLVECERTTVNRLSRVSCAAS